ncbi:adenine-specific methyltransferase EcoRI family protein [Mycoplasma sp. CSL7475-4]|uniref:adenine-specific methyltransferase EcoRI family protein n=1 Tax=Mycoplasma sp. CSL7475-4 TaxID=2973942 RepID=UPI00216AD985|nr:adenine-specific methyltransferase EcoRI family protein [Mycoplasma sp. CSL7475-4]MCS4536763.1 adenine-specific methyltransferase EcoRI family protein [Mycoplasma sp. CSL7475-4]
MAKHTVNLEQTLEAFRKENSFAENHNSKLIRAFRNKNDEFFTLYESIENEMEHWAESGAFRGREVMLPCDDINLFDGLIEGLKHSNFWVYFHKNFERLGLKSLRCTFLNNEGNTNIYEYRGGDDENFDVYTSYAVNSNGDFHDAVMWQEYQKSDLIITNPPFSQLKDFLTLLEGLKIDFLIIVPPTFMLLAPALRNFKNNAWNLGYTNVAAEFFDARSMENNNLKISKGGPHCYWLTSLKLQKIVEPKKSKKPPVIAYDEFPDILNCDTYAIAKEQLYKNTKEQLYGVPITSINQYDFRDLFEIVCCFSRCMCQDKAHMKKAVVNGKEKFGRLIVKAK